MWKIDGNYVFTSDPPLYPVKCTKCGMTNKLTFDAIIKENSISTEERIMVLTKDEYDIILNMVLNELDEKHVVYLPDWEELPTTYPENFKPRCFDKTVCNGNRTDGVCGKCKFKINAKDEDSFSERVKDLEELDNKIQYSLTISDEAMERKVDL